MATKPVVFLRLATVRGHVIALACLLILLSGPIGLQHSIALAADETAAEMPIASLRVTIEPGRFTWQIRESTSLAAVDQPRAYHRGFLIALDQAIVLRGQASSTLTRLEPDSALPVDEGQRLLPLAVVPTPTTFAVFEFLPESLAREPSDDTTLKVKGGDYTIELWQHVLHDGDVESINDRIGSLTALALLYARDGEITFEHDERDDDLTLLRREAGIIDRNTQLADETDDGAVVLATIRRAGPPAPNTADSSTTGGATGTGTGSVPPNATATRTPTSTARTGTGAATSTPGSGGGADDQAGGADDAVDPDIFGDSVVTGNNRGCEILGDADSDGLSACEEARYGSNPNDPDSDDDGSLDGAEKLLGTSPIESDSDNDSLSDTAEYNAGTSPLLYDTDGDGVTDPNEYSIGTNPTVADTDQDHLSDGDELYGWATDPLKFDSDGEGCSDGREVLWMGTNPHNPDTDGDGYSDLQEYGTSNPLDPDDEPGIESSVCS